MTPRSRTTARNAALVNLLATPGLGSLMARRWLAGTGQLILAVAGFGLMLGWFVKLMTDYYGLMFNQQSAPQLDFRLLKWGAAIFAVAWLWSLVTSVQLLRAVKTLPPESKVEPPVLPR